MLLPSKLLIAAAVLAVACAVVVVFLYYPALTSCVICALIGSLSGEIPVIKRTIDRICGRANRFFTQAGIESLSRSPSVSHNA